MDKPLISVVIPTYNYVRFIGQCIESVLAQTYEKIEIIVINDGSTDGTLFELKKFNERIMTISTKNQGACMARNTGFNYSKGEYVSFLDSDDFWLPNMIETLYSQICQTNADLVYCDSISFDEEAEIQFATSRSAKIDLSWFHENPGRTPFAPSSVLLSRDLISRTSGWNTSLRSPAEDFDFFRRCAKHGNIMYVNKPLVFHRNHSKSLTAESDIRYFQDNVRAARLMLVEDREILSLKKRLRCWLKLHLQFMKHAIKNRDFFLLGKVVKNYLWV